MKTPMLPLPLAILVLALGLAPATRAASPQDQAQQLSQDLQQASPSTFSAIQDFAVGAFLGGGLATGIALWSEAYLLAGGGVGLLGLSPAGLSVLAAAVVAGVAYSVIASAVRGAFDSKDQVARGRHQQVEMLGLQQGRVYGE